MNSRAKLLGHSIHQMLIVFPLGLLGMGAVFDGIYSATNDSRFVQASFWMLVAGVVSGLIAAVFGVIDWTAIPSGTRAKRVGILHGGVMVAAVAAFAASIAARWDTPVNPSTLALILSFAGLALAVLGGWLGGELVTRLGVGVDDGANVNAPSSLFHSSAHDVARIGAPAAAGMTHRTGPSARTPDAD